MRRLQSRLVIGMNDATVWLGSQLASMDAALAALVNQNSFTENREGGQRVVQLLEALFDVPGLIGARHSSQRFADHLVFRSEGQGAPIALIGHLDTVFPPGRFEGYRVDGPLRRGPGVLDMKGGLVVMAWALKALAQTVGLAAIAPLRVVIVSDEEVGSPEGGPLVRQTIADCAAALVFESGRKNDSIVTRRKGTGSALAVASGKAAHAGNAYWEGGNAIWALSRFVDRAQKLSDRASGVTVNVGVIGGGTAKNTVPDEAHAMLDLRYPTQALGEHLWAGLRSAAEGLDVEGTHIDLELGPGRVPMEKLPKTDALFARYASCAMAFGLAAGEAPLQGGGSDGNTAASMGIATLDALGPRGEGFHTVNEYIEAHTLQSRAQALASFLFNTQAGG